MVYNERKQWGARELCGIFNIEICGYFSFSRISEEDSENIPGLPPYGRGTNMNYNTLTHSG